MPSSRSTGSSGSSGSSPSPSQSSSLPSSSRPAFLFAPGAGAPSSSAWMIAWRDRLASLGEVVPFDYPYMRAGRKSPDRLPVLIEAHRAALASLRAKAAGPIS